ncbi:dihydroorotate dehydrogenase electron transfer subunit [Bacillus sp. FJAT-42376]|uniref:dihydroorotate dehydrogenase electron transfer subunit n=1 Tax=Bacillus sp. FJAT-42376 TaxID=2014076 RepID=UPI000F4FFB6F|nr:dihydroorotate dehydrogenase electron transfer subunit [Bacillus sp. FJAT-42376]AZB42865.1 dihydroorotate dehydrogenase electron transfer subunit [Bacillus sp. FJAT-42376]
MIGKEEMLVVSHEEIAKDIFELVLQGELTEQMEAPGQFVHVKVSETAIPLLRRPISIARIDRADKTLTLIYRRGGEGTALLSRRNEGERVDLIGPLGNGFPADESVKGKKVLLAGGGIGVPPLYELSHQLKNLGAEPVHVLGFENKEAVFYEAEFARLGETYFSTADGSFGVRGFVTDAIREHGLSFDRLYACGPTPMLKALENLYSDKEVYLSLEERMGCGIGACFACVCHVPGDEKAYKKVCSDGPVFRAGEVVLSC